MHPKNVVLISNSGLLDLIKLLFQGIQLFIQTYFIFRTLHIDSQVYELPRDEKGLCKEKGFDRFTYYDHQ